jgi:hypothetical protein
MLKSLHHYEDRQCRMSDAEVMTTAIIAMLYFKGNFCLASQYLYEHHYIPNMLSRSRFNRRLHRIADLFLTLFLRLGETWKKLNERSVYVIDSYPIAVCDNYRIKRSKIYHGEDFRGYIASNNTFAKKQMKKRRAFRVKLKSSQTTTYPGKAHERDCSTFTNYCASCFSDGIETDEPSDLWSVDQQRPADDVGNFALDRSGR